MEIEGHRRFLFFLLFEFGGERVVLGQRGLRLGDGRRNRYGRTGVEVMVEAMRIAAQPRGLGQAKVLEILVEFRITELRQETRLSGPVNRGYLVD